MITITNDELSVTIDEALGGEICQITYAGHPLLACYDWKTPVPANRSHTYGDDNLDWLSEYRGGWQFLAPNAGQSCVVDGVPLPFHGEWSRTQVDIEEETDASITVSAGTRLPFEIRRTISLLANPTRMQVRTTIVNVGDTPSPYVWGEHPAFLGDAGDHIDLQPGPVIDRDSDSQTSAQWPADPSGGGTLDVVPAERPCTSVHFLPDRTHGWVALRRPHVGLALSWDLAAYPHLWVWRELASSGFPFYGRSSIIALEPVSVWPGDGLAAAIERDQAHWLDAGESRSNTVTLTPFRPDGRIVTGAGHDGQVEFA